MRKWVKELLLWDKKDCFKSSKLLEPGILRLLFAPPGFQNPSFWNIFEPSLAYFPKNITNMWVLAVLGAHWYLSLFTQTFFHHRYAAHRMFTMNKGWEKFFYVISFFFQGSSYLSPRAYGIMHRMHHAYADTELDPHSPKYDPNLFAMMWRTRNTYKNIYDQEVEVEAKFMKDLPDWDSFDKFASNGYIRLVWVAIYVLIYFALDAPWWLFPLIFIHAVMGPFHGVIINWFAHSIGYINFKMKDTSRNLFPVDILMLGEGLHNNHHKHSGRANFGWKKYEFDPIYPVIKFLDFCKVIKLRRTPVAAETHVNGNIVSMPTHEPVESNSY